MKTKGEASALIQTFFAMVETQFQTKIKAFMTDNGPKFTLKHFYNSKGVIY